MNSNYQSPSSCILDPALALSRFGVYIVENLGETMDLWVGREFWNIIGNTDFYQQRPELVIPKKSNQTSQEECAAIEETLWSLKQWERMKKKTDLSRLNLFWIGDSLQESFLPKSTDLELFWCWEFLARSLDSELNHHTNEVMSLAFRDTAALAASLGSAFVLTYQYPNPHNAPPDICVALENWGIPCHALAKEQMIAEERNYFRQIIVRTGLAKLLWTGLRLVVLHFVAPAASAYPNFREEHEYLQESTRVSSSRSEQALISPEELTRNLELKNYSWKNIEAFWYSL